ncbi:MAG: DNA cytosine methyltransferase [Clostridium sp.]|nr:DNA cytosine methyltransferase [Clostridium sp.]
MRVASFFAGCGGLDLGFRQAGFDVVWANELEPRYRDTYLRNHPDTELVIGDIRRIDPAVIPDCDGFIGAPPCQSWSVGGKMNGLDDDRGKLFLKYIELIRAKQPGFFVIENVKGMLDDKFRAVFEDFISRLDSSGYNVHWTLLDSVKFRIPQNRERVFLIGFRKGMKIKYNFPNPTCDEPVSLERAIGNIQDEPIRVTGNVRRSSYGPATPVGKYHNHGVLDSEFGPFYYRGNRRRDWHQPSFTINATAEFAPLHPSSPKMQYFGHENWDFQKNKLSQYRRLSVRECARIQTFPDSFIFDYDDIKTAYRMIGNAVPPRLGYELARSVRCALQQIDETYQYTTR